MATVSLGTLVTNLRMEVGHSSNPATGTNMRDQMVYIINRTQEELATDFDWPGLTVDRDVLLTTGTRYYSYPDDMPFENVDQVWLFWNTINQRLEYGIGPPEFAVWNSAVGFKSWPVSRWMHNSDMNLFELWPVPSQAPAATPTSQAALVRMRGTRAIPWMTADADVCTLPATLVTLFAAAEYLAREKSPDAQMKLEKAREAIRRLRIRQSSHKTKPFIMGGGGPRSAGRPGFTHIPPGYGKGP